MDAGSIHTRRSAGAVKKGRSQSPSINGPSSGRDYADGRPQYERPQSAVTATSLKRPVSPYEYRSDDADILNSRVGIYGWRKRCLYLFEVCIAVVLILNLALLVWITRIMDFSINGMGNLHIESDRVTVDGRSEFVSGLFARSVTSEKDEALRLLSTNGVNITAGRTQFVLGSRNINARADRFELRNSDGSTYFLVTPTQLTTSATNVVLNSSRGASFQEYIQTRELRGEPGSNLHLLASSGALVLRSGKQLNIQSSGSGISLTSPSAVQLNAGSGKIILNSSTVLLSGLPVATSTTTPSQPAGNVYEVCVCGSSGQLFLAQATAGTGNSPCLAAGGVC